MHGYSPGKRPGRSIVGNIMIVKAHGWQKHPCAFLYLRNLRRQRIFALFSCIPTDPPADPGQQPVYCKYGNNAQNSSKQYIRRIMHKKSTFCWNQQWLQTQIPRSPPSCNNGKLPSRLKKRGRYGRMGRKSFPAFSRSAQRWNPLQRDAVSRNCGWTFLKENISQFNKIVFYSKL